MHASVSRPLRSKKAIEVPSAQPFFHIPEASRKRDLLAVLESRRENITFLIPVFKEDI
jgi:hypothetical protein